MSEFTSFFRLEIRPPRPSGWRIRAEVGRLVEGVRATLNMGHRLERARKVARRQQTMLHDAPYAEAPHQNATRVCAAHFAPRQRSRAMTGQRRFERGCPNATRLGRSVHPS